MCDGGECVPACPSGIFEVVPDGTGQLKAKVKEEARIAMSGIPCLQQPARSELSPRLPKERNKPYLVARRVNQQ